MDEKDLYIFGEPVKTLIGEVRFLTYKEYLVNITSLSLITQNILHLYYQYKKHIDEKDENALNLLESIKQLTLFDLVKSEPSLFEIYKKFFTLLISPKPEIEDPAEIILSDENLFVQYRQLIMEMNLLSEEMVSPNPEIQRGIEMSRSYKQQTSGESSFTDIVSSIVAGTTNSFKDVCEMTVYQVYATYYRMGAIFDYQTSTLFATVSEKVKIESWNKHLNLYERESHVIEKDSFDKKFGSMF
ncbi:hypothetical protein NSQ62_07795 [Solibacillus sp. FSL H8-0523]|uniref:hypothetical protein n=1 Tax=Solibacillus sp. FSL H8-0523 TaxID=2954511 RepID=UPI003101183A